MKGLTPVPAMRRAHVDKEDGRLPTTEQASTLRAAATRIGAVIGC